MAFLGAVGGPGPLWVVGVASAGGGGLPFHIQGPAVGRGHVGVQDVVRQPRHLRPGPLLLLHQTHTSVLQYYSYSSFP